VTSLDRYRGALMRVVTLLARGDDVPAELERELAAAEVAAIECGAPVELLDDLVLCELELRGQRGRSRP
jgi:hypothetical protein